MGAVSVRVDRARGGCASAKCYPACVLQVARLYQKLHVDNAAAGSPVSDVHRHMKNVRIISLVVADTSERPVIVGKLALQCAGLNTSMGMQCNI